MDNPLERKPPEDPIARVHEFARDLAWGAAHGKWGTGFRYDAFSPDDSWSALTTGGNYQEHFRHYLHDKWGGLPPDYNLLRSLGYFELENQRYIGDHFAFLLTPKAFSLLEKPASPPQIFISYRQNESSPFALLIEARLTLRDPTIGIFIDKLIEGGAKWLKRIEQEVRQCDTFIIVYGPDTPNSKTIPLEIAWAEETGSTIIPVLHHGFTRCCEGYPERFRELNDIPVEKESAKAYENAITDILIALGLLDAPVPAPVRGPELTTHRKHKAMAETPTMFDEFSYTGYWWLPENSGKRWSGTVFFRPEEGIFLELIRDPNQDHKLPSLENNEQTIHGLIIDNPCEVTLQGCQSSGSHVQFIDDGVEKRDYRAKLFLKGVWLSPSEDITYRSAGVAFSSLDGWMQTSDPEKSAVPFTVEADESHLKATYQRKPPVEIHIPDEGMKLVCDTGISESWGTHHLRWLQSSYITIVPDAPMSQDWILKKLFSTRDLLALLTGLPVELNTINASLGTSETYCDVGELPPRVTMYFPSKTPVIDTDSEITMPFPLDALGDSAEEVFNQWFKKQSQYRTVIELCLTIIYSRIRLNRFEFLALMQALESFHRVKHKIEDMSLKRRIESLHESLPPGFRYVVYSDEYLQTLIDTRTCFTHDIDKKCERALQGPDLYDATTRLIAFIATLLYMELGLRGEKIFHEFTRVQFYGLWGRPPLHR